ncbi:MAG: sugar phosphate isomerase/epimerase [Chthoniobacteraceae bacterium]
MSSKTRREFVQLALASLPAAGLLSIPSRLSAADAKPNSKVAGVQIGMNVPYSFGPVTDGDEILKTCVQLGLSGVELRAQPVEVFMGAPKDLIYPPKKDKNAPKTEAPKAESTAPKTTMKEWRKTAPMDRAKEFRAKWEAAGVLIEIVKVDGIFKMSDEELDYAFTLAKTLGGRAISSEISHTEAELKRVGQFADKHQLMVGYHGHATTKPEHWEAAFALAKFNGANVDLGHFVAGNNTSPVPFLKKYHDRITHVHVKDRKFNNGGNTPLGEGDTPIAEVLRLIRDKKWNIQATIEFEYKVPEGSDRMKELARTIEFCRKALAS